MAVACKFDCVDICFIIILFIVSYLHVPRVNIIKKILIILCAGLILKIENEKLRFRYIMLHKFKTEVIFRCDTEL